MISLTVVLSLVAVAAYVALAYLNGRLIVRMVTATPEPLSTAGAPLLGAAAIGVQLWLYGLASIPWNPITLVAPWLVAWVIARHRLIEALRQDWAFVCAEAQRIRRQDRLTLILVGVAGLLLVTYALNLVTQPLTGFDAVSMWFFKAKQFYAEGSVDPGSIAGLATSWPSDPGPYVITARVIRSLDYPPLFSLMVASIYALTWGVHDTLGKGVDVMYVVSGFAIVWTAVSRFAGVGRAAVVAFLAVAIAAVQTAMQDPLYTGYADYPLGVAMVASLANLHRGLTGGRTESWIFAMLFASVAALLKSEGLPFLLLVTAVVAMRSWRSLLSAPVLISAAPVVAWQAFVAFNGWSSHHLLNDSLTTLPFIVPTRAALIVAYIAQVIAMRIDHLWLAAAFAVTAWLVWRQSHDMVPVLAVFVLQCGVYFGVLVLNPGEVVGSLDRLIIQLAPTIVLMLGLAMGSERESAPASSTPRMELIRQ